MRRNSSVMDVVDAAELVQHIIFNNSVQKCKVEKRQTDEGKWMIQN